MKASEFKSNGNRIINNKHLSIIERKKVLNELLETIKVNNWYCGIITLHYAFNNRCTIDSKCEQNKVRRLLKKNGFIPHFNGGILSILITI